MNINNLYNAIAAKAQEVEDALHAGNEELAEELGAELSELEFELEQEEMEAMHHMRADY